MIQLQHPFGQDHAKNIGVLILGLGESGAAMARWCKHQGAQVIVIDTRQQDQLSESAKKYLTQVQNLGVEAIYFGDLSEELLANVSVIAISPGLSPITQPVASFLRAAAEKNIPVWSEIEFFAQAINSLKQEQDYQTKIIAITGTNGKTTTTALTGLLCERAGQTVGIAGNISPAALDKLLDIEDLPQVWVLELSSFQLQHTYSLNPDVATVLNISQDHLDWHGSFENYVAAKARIFGPNTTWVINRDDPYVLAMVSDTQSRVIRFGEHSPTEDDEFGIFHDAVAGGIDWLVWAEPDWEALELRTKKRRKKSAQDDGPLRLKRLMPADALRIKGRHNAVNALAATALVNAIGLPMGPVLHGLREYEGEAHRVQSISIVNDVEYIDDSKGTNVGATIAALNGLGQLFARQNIILIAGGDGKGQDFSSLLSPVSQYAKAVILIGRDATRIQEAIQPSHVRTLVVSDLTCAVKEAATIAQSGDIVLLSPACASFDMFKDYAHRAQVFIEAVHELALQHGQVSA